MADHKSEMINDSQSNISKKIRKFILKTLKESSNGIAKKILKSLIFQDDDVMALNLPKDHCKSVYKTMLLELQTDNKVHLGEDKILSYISKSERKRKREVNVNEVCDDDKVTKDVNLQKLGESTKDQAYPVIERTGHTTILLFYAYCSPVMTRTEQDDAIKHCKKVLTKLGMTGRLRIGREGYNCTLTGNYESVRNFTNELRKYDSKTFAETDFKYVDNQPDNYKLKDLKVWPVSEIVTYGFNAAEAPLDLRGTHLTPKEFHEALVKPDSVVIDVRNFNETVIGKFQPPTNDLNEKVLDPCMRRSTEFPKWVEDNKHKLEGKQVLMYCTAGVRCERASAYMRNKGIENVFQLEGGIHRYLDAFPEDGGYWVGKNYTFDKRFSHGAKNATTISSCVFCDQPWDRYQAQKKCAKCSMEILLCKTCQRMTPPPSNKELFCPLCKPKK